MALSSVQAQSNSAKLFAKKSKASKLFNSECVYNMGLIQRLNFHCNGNPQEPFRKLDVFVAHNTAQELSSIGLLSENAAYLSQMDGRDRQLCHLHSLSQAASYPGGKINNISNLAVLLRETNQMIGKRIISRGNAEVLDRMIHSGNYIAARLFANRVCS